MRDYRFDVARVLCMTYIVAFVHLWAYVYPNVISAIYVHPSFAILTNSCLGLFTFTSGYLLGGKYSFGADGNISVWAFYKRRVIRIVPLFIISAFILYFIGFNGARASLNGVLCLSPFIKPRPKTLWYIPVILFCYSITPLVCRKNEKWQFLIAISLVLFIWLLRSFIPSVDWRLQFNLLLYLVGLLSVRYLDWKFENREYIKWGVIVLFIGLISATLFMTPGLIYKRIVSVVGVFALLFICDFICKLVFYGKNNRKGQGENDSLWVSLIKSVSYASMACYMFHRLFFWIGELLWNPMNPIVKWVYMGCVVFPIMLAFCYYIQFGYDKMMTAIQSEKKKENN